MKIVIVAFPVLFGLVGIAQADAVTIAAFNVENLFDTTDDADNPRDDTYLPLTAKDLNRPAHDAKCEQFNGPSTTYIKQCKDLDWSEAVYATKLQRIGDVINAMPAKPNVLVIPETENKAVLVDLVARHLAGEGYSVIQLDTSDDAESRGIDVGILTKLPIVGDPVAHVIDFGSNTGECGKTRDIVQAQLQLPDGESLYVFGVHFPSGGNPLKCRIRAFVTLNSLVGALPDNSLAIAAGDFNINCNESPTDAFKRLLTKGNWYASPLITHGCAAPGSSKFVDRQVYSWNTWSFLDMILVSGEMSPSRPSQKNWFADLGSFGTIVVHPEQVMVDTNDHGYVEPRRFDPASGRGVSDHWPVTIRLLNRRGG